MPCNHRFQDQLLPIRPRLDYLFIGTFNPVWNAANGNNAQYFYGRATNLFWCIMPHAFNQPCLIDQDSIAWQAFCTQFNIGSTDLISCIPNADQANPDHIAALTSGFKDEALDQKITNTYVFQLEFITEQICDLITNHQTTLRGVFFTRNTRGGLTRIWQQWLKIKAHCQNLDITAEALPSPSPRRGNIRKKLHSGVITSKITIELQGKKQKPLTSKLTFL